MGCNLRICNLNRTRLGKINTLENDWQKLEHDQQGVGFTEDRKKEISSVTANMNNILRTTAEFQIHRTMRNYYLIGSKPSQILALRNMKNILTP